MDGCLRGLLGLLAAGHRVARGLGRAVAAVLLAVITIYQRIVSPALAPRCRFEPSCSAYAAACLRRYSLWRALAKSAWRLVRCHPLCSGGYDPPEPACGANGSPHE